MRPHLYLCPRCSSSGAALRCLDCGWSYERDGSPPTEAPTAHLPTLRRMVQAPPDDTLTSYEDAYLEQVAAVEDSGDER